MGASVVLTSHGVREVELELGRLFEALGDLSPLMEQFGIYLESAWLERFEREEGPDGRKWQKSIRAKETGGKTLTDHAILKQSGTYIAGRDRVEQGTNVAYAGPLHHGATIRGKNGKLKFRLPGGLGFRTMDQVVLPARPIVGVGREDETELLALTKDYVAAAAPELSA